MGTAGIKRTLRTGYTRCFLALDRIGIHVLPKHYYSPVPDYAWLRANRTAWDGPASMAGIAWDVDAQLDWLRETCAPYYAEVAGAAHIRYLTSRLYGPGYGEIEAQVLHCVIRAHKPRTIIEVGSGLSTAVMQQASIRNCADGADASRITCVDPYASAAVTSLDGVEVVRAPLQTAALSLFDTLTAGDLLFIDSSHAVKVGSDVVHLYSEIVPRLPPGVLIHIHDIYLPYRYTRTALTDIFAWQENVLVLALLTHNPHLAVLCCQSALHYDRPHEMAAILTDYRPEANDAGLAANPRMGDHFPASLWLGSR